MEFRGKPLNVRTIHFRLGVVKTFFKFMHKSGRIYHDPMANYTLPKQPKTLPRNIGDVAEVRALIECPNVAEPLGKRDKALLELVYSCGLRNQEVRSLELRHLDLKGRQLRVLGKGGSENVVPFGECAGKALEDYLLFGRGELVKKESEKDFLFLSNLGLPISTEALRQIFMKYCKKAGIEKELRAHSLRHSCATHLLQNGADIRHIQRLLRHQSLDTTQIYTRVDVGDLRQAQLKYHPREQR
jgi:site-specific recombinase XerD